MSLGFLTESALLPSKAKKIEVDSKSMVGLKALVYESEQRREQNAATRGQGHRKLRKREVREKPSSSEKRNKNVEERILRDEEELAEDDKTKHYQSALRAKAEIYEKIKRGEMEAGMSTSFLVDFARKREEPADCDTKDDESDDDVRRAPAHAPDSEESEIEDEFGRQKMVKRRSIEYKEYHTNKRRRQQDPGVRPESFSNAEPEAVVSAASSFAWSTGVAREDVAEWMPTEERKAAEEELQRAVEHEIRMSKSARVRTQWETTLDSRARDFIHQVHREVEVERSQASGSQPSARDQRRELLRQKKAARVNQLKQQERLQSSSL